MNTTNYYLILGLSINPPETDPKVIEDAIANKQAEWSRQRNHPSKGTLAQKYIGMLPEIRKVMSDPAQRKKEASEARQILLKQAQEKFWKIDRHLGIFFGKGHVTDKEIAKLSQLHSMPEDKIRRRVEEGEKFWKADKQIEKLVSKGKVGDKQIAKLAKQAGIAEDKLRERIAKKEEGVFREIDKYLHICMNRGFVTGEEIAGLARLFDIGEDKVLKRVRCPIRKKGKQEEAKPEPLDSTIEQIINEKLRIVGKKDLYDFLDISPDAGSDALSNRAKEKEAEIRKIGQKDAMTTANGALAGHCVAMFESQESRNAYDLSILRRRLRRLDADIEASESDGKIRGEYLGSLLKIALRLGTAPEQAEAYIREYCAKKGWSIEQSPKQKKMRLTMIAGIAGAAVLLLLIVFSVWAFNSVRLRADYQKTLVEAENQPNPDQKERVLKEFLKRRGNTEYSPKIEKKIEEVRDLIRKRDFEAALKEEEKLSQARELEKIIPVFEQYLKKHPDGIHATEAKQKIARISEQIDDRDYEAVKSFKGDFEAKVKQYDGYLEKHPKGRHTGDVRKLMSDMMSGYYDQLKKELNVCERKEDWDTCIGLCGKFMEKFAQSPQATEAEGLRIKFQKNKQHRDDLSDMRQKSLALGENYEDAKKIYTEYLEANPESSPYMKKMIEAESASLDKQIQRRDREKKEWEMLSAYLRNVSNTLTERVRRLDTYVNANPTVKYVAEAKKILEELKKQKAAEDEKLHAERENVEWQELLALAKNPQTGLADRIGRFEQYLARNASGKYAQQAKDMLDKMRKEKAIEDERLRTQGAEAARRNRETKMVRDMLGQTGGRFADAGDGTVTDTQTGLMWTLLDSSGDLGRCLNYPSAEQYAKNLRVGGYKNWRLPTAGELVGIYKTDPSFPTATRKWFWSSELFWHGWNKRVYVVNTEKEKNPAKKDMDVEKCGTVHAVRRR